MQPAATSVLVYDYALRIFHWSFAGALSAALVLGLTAEKHSSLFAWHMLFGLTAGFLLLLRIVMGVAGTRYARFSRMPVRPAQISAHVRGLLDDRAKHHVGHNPGSALAALAMFLTVPSLLATGLVANGDPWEEVHGFFANVLLAVIGIHLAGLIWHTIQHRENIAVAMISGRKAGRPEDAIASARPGWAVAGALAASAWIGGLWSSHDAAGAKVRLPLTSLTITLGENEGHDPRRTKEKRKHRDDDNP